MQKKSKKEINYVKQKESDSHVVLGAVACGNRHFQLRIREL
jgi:hypothetical protein